MNMSMSLILLFVVLTVNNAAIPGDEVSGLPGWNGRLPTAQYSGYIPVDNAMTRFIHYWFVESQGDPSKDPVVMWMNGGPGCSSLEGYFYELGPLHFLNDTPNQPHPQLVENPNTWVKLANMLFIEAPVGVGFSYSTKGKDDYVTNDTRTATDNLQFLLNFFSAYSEYRMNDFYISGESYAGIYIPTLVDLIRLHNMKVTNSTDLINLKGFMVGNGCIGNKVGVCSLKGLGISVKFLYYHALISEEVYAGLTEKCGYNLRRTSPQCVIALSKAMKMTGPVNVYNIYAPCINNFHSADDEQRVWRTHMPTDDPLVGVSECDGAGVSTSYLNTPEVREALHVKPKSEIGRWRMCTTNISYFGNVDSVLDIYPTLIQKYRTLIYNGDVDDCVPYIDNEEWTSGLGFPVKEPWRPWFVNEQVAGYVTSYEINDFTFITVKGSGHMVPQYRPVSAYAMFERFIKDREF
jgi:carboxypeptidase C (cathepsin A)